MKTIMFKISGSPTPGDLIMLNQCGKRGGRSTAKYVVKGKLEWDELIYVEENNVQVPQIKHHRQEPDTLDDIAREMAGIISASSGEWSPGSAGDFKAKAHGSNIIVMCSELVDGTTFSADVEGAQTEVVEVEELV